MRISADDLINVSAQKIEDGMNNSLVIIPDEYETLDEKKATGIKLLVKRATNWINSITQENGEYFILQHRADDIQKSLEDWSSYYSNIKTKLKIIAKYIRERES